MVVPAVRTPDLADSRSPSVTIKWEACSTVTLEDAKRFRNDLEDAIRLAEASDQELTHDLARLSSVGRLSFDPGATSGQEMQNEIIYQAHRDAISDDLIVVERTESKRFLTSIVCGNFPLDYLTKYEAEFETEEDAVSAADAVRDGLLDPDQALREL